MFASGGACNGACGKTGEEGMRPENDVFQIAAAPATVTGEVRMPLAERCGKAAHCGGNLNPQAGRPASAPGIPRVHEADGVIRSR